MNVVVRHRIMSLVDFLAWEDRQEFRWEFDGFEAVAMTGGSHEHAALERNLAYSLTARLRGGRCAFYGSNLKVVTGDRVRYPDGQILYGPVASDAMFTTTPVVLFEVTSPSTERVDRADKADEYRRIASVTRYVILAQDRQELTVHVRDGEAWTQAQLGPDDVLALPELGIEVPVAELYDGL